MLIHCGVDWRWFPARSHKPFDVGSIPTPVTLLARTQLSDTKLVGDLSEKMVMVELLKRGCKILQPVGDRLPYDLAVDKNGNLVRIQVKTAYYVEKDDSYLGKVSVCKTNRKKYKQVKCDTENVDYFIYVVQEHNAHYVMPAELVKQYKSGISFTPHRKRLKDSSGIEAKRECWDNLIG